jgi:hypothetical protein
MPEYQSQPADQPRCPVCGIKVGVYEPAVFVTDHWALRGSRALRADLLDEPGCVLYHESCYDQADSARLEAV